MMQLPRTDYDSIPSLLCGYTDISWNSFALSCLSLWIDLPILVNMLDFRKVLEVMENLREYLRIDAKKGQEAQRRAARKRKEA